MGGWGLLDYVRRALPVGVWAARRVHTNIEVYSYVHTQVWPILCQTVDVIIHGGQETCFLKNTATAGCVGNRSSYTTHPIRGTGGPTSRAGDPATPPRADTYRYRVIRLFASCERCPAHNPQDTHGSLGLRPGVAAPDENSTAAARESDIATASRCAEAPWGV